VPLSSRSFALVVSAYSAVLVAAGCTSGPKDHRPVVDELVAPLLRDGWTNGLVVGLAAPGRTEFYAYGAVAPGGPLPDERTVFEIGSITKAFTSLVLATMVERGEVSLTDPAQDLLGASPILPTRNGRAITLQHLATHTAGLPRMPDGFSPADPGDPYADFGVAALDAFLGAYALPVDPGTRYDYSNLGAGLLGHVLARKAATSYAELVRVRIAEPLGLVDTAIALTPEQSARLAQGHDGDLVPAPHWTFDALAGAGALRSTARDLLHYAAAEAGAEASPLASAMALSQVPRFDIDGQTQTGLAWVIADRRFVWHSGGTGGFESFAGFDPATHTAVVVLSSASTSFQPATQLGLAFLSMMAGQAPGAVSVPPLVAVAGPVLDRYAGTYRLIDPASGQPAEIVVRRDGDLLRSSVPGDTRTVRLYPADETTFFVRAGEIPTGVQFQLGAGGAPDSVVIEQAGTPRITATRVP